MFRFVAEGQVRLVALVDLKGQLTDETCLFAFLTLWRRHNEVELQPTVISKPKLTECLHREHNATSTSSREAVAANAPSLWHSGTRLEGAGAKDTMTVVKN